MSGSVFFDWNCWDANSSSCNHDGRHNIGLSCGSKIATIKRVLVFYQTQSISQAIYQTKDLAIQRTMSENEKCISPTYLLPNIFSWWSLLNSGTDCLSKTLGPWAPSVQAWIATDFWSLRSCNSLSSMLTLAGWSSLQASDSTHNSFLMSLSWRRRKGQTWDRSVYVKYVAPGFSHFGDDSFRLDTGEVGENVFLKQMSLTTY